jgi:death on curing protein
VNPEFLDVDDVLELHATLIVEHGGSDGIRDRGLLESAVAQPMASFGGEFLHDLLEMAAALLVSLVGNHPFVDGNKRTGLAAMLMFLELNGYSVDESTRALVDLTLAVASGLMSKAQVAQLLRDCAEHSD